MTRWSRPTGRCRRARRVDLDLSQTVRAAGPFILPVIGASILADIGVTIGFVLLIVPGFILLTFWCLIVPFIVVGGRGVPVVRQ